MSGSSTVFSTGEYPLRAAKLNTAFSERVLRGGDAMVGPLTLARDPLVAFEAVTKQYVDTRVVDMSHVAMDDYGLTYLAGGLAIDTESSVSAGVSSWNTRIGNVFLTLSDVTAVGGLSSATAAVTYLPLTGGNLSGQLSVNGKMIASQVMSGDIIDGGLITSWSSGYGAAAGFYYEHATNGLLFGNIDQFNALITTVLMRLNGNGVLTLTHDPVGALDAVTKRYADGALAGPVDGFAYGRQNNAWAKVLPLAGGNLTGQLTVSGKMIANQVMSSDIIDGGLLTSWSTGYGTAAGIYYDHATNGIFFGGIDQAAGIMTSVLMKLNGTGVLSLTHAPVNALDATTKQYVDSAIIAGNKYVEAPTGGAVYGRQNGTTWTSVLPITGGNLTGQITVNGKMIANQVMSSDIINGGMVTSWSSGYGTAAGLYYDQPSNGLFFGNINQASALMTTVLMRLNGSGVLTLTHDPVGALDAVTKQYVDTRVSNPGSGYLPISGGSLTGPLSVSGKMIANQVMSSDIIGGGMVMSWSSGYDEAMGFQFNHTNARMDVGLIDQASSLFTSLLMTLSVAGGLKITGGLGTFGITAPTSRPTVTGSRAGNAALASLLTALAATGLISDGTTA